MRHIRYTFSHSSTDYYFAGGISNLKDIVDLQKTIFITDENIFNCYQKKFSNWDTLVIPSGEQYKVQATADRMIAQLLEKKADRKTTLIGIGGGVITDITGYVASIFMRGIRFGFIPTTLLAMVDASIGGKNGIDVGVFKNMVGIIRQPSFILHDLTFLNTLPVLEWQNGFAEIIKHASIKDAVLFKQLEESSIKKYQVRKKSLGELIERNVMLKSKLVKLDEFETGDRKLLNFGHTLGHALENLYKLSHGHAVSIGMSVAGLISEQRTGFKDSGRLIALLDKYGLPTAFEFDSKKVFEILKMDKKKAGNSMQYVLLNKIGKAVIKEIPIDNLEKWIESIASAR
jgi:3-dehydroquinate synthase